MLEQVRRECKYDTYNKQDTIRHFRTFLKNINYLFRKKVKLKVLFCYISKYHILLFVYFIQFSFCYFGYFGVCGPVAQTPSGVCQVTPGTCSFFRTPRTCSLEHAVSFERARQRCQIVEPGVRKKEHVPENVCSKERPCSGCSKQKNTLRMFEQVTRECK